MKKEKIVLFGFLFLILSINLIFAQNYFNAVIENLIRDTVGAIESILRPIIGGETGDQLFFAKIAFFFLTFAVVFVALNNTEIFGGNRGALVITTLAVSIISARYVPDVGIIKAMILPYVGFFTALVITGLPIFIIFFVHYLPTNSFIRRFIIGGFGLSYLFVWVGSVYVTEWDLSGANNWFTSLPFIILAIGFFGDRWIREAIERQRHESAADEVTERAVQKWIEELRRAEENNSHMRARKIRQILRRRYGVRI